MGLCFRARAFSRCGKRGPLFIAVRGPLTIAASLVAEHRLQTRRLSSCGSRAQLLCGMWGLPRPGLEPASPALAGRFSTTAPPGKPKSQRFNQAGYEMTRPLFERQISGSRVTQRLVGGGHPTRQRERERGGESPDLDKGGCEDGEKWVVSRCVLEGVFMEPSTYPT